MGWRTDQAYEEARRKDFQEWKASLTWRNIGHGNGSAGNISCSARHLSRPGFS